MPALDKFTAERRLIQLQVPLKVAPSAVGHW